MKTAVIIIGTLAGIIIAIIAWELAIALFQRPVTDLQLPTI